MTITGPLPKFSSRIHNLLFLLSQTWQPQSRLPPPLPPHVEAPEAAQPAQLDLEGGNENMNWASIVVPYCLTSAIAVALSFHKLNPKFSSTIHLFSFTILLCFASFFIRYFIESKFQKIARVFYGVGIFFAVTSFFIANTIDFPLWLKIMSWLVYAVSFLLIFASRCQKFRASESGSIDASPSALSGSPADAPCNNVDGRAPALKGSG